MTFEAQILSVDSRNHKNFKEESINIYITTGGKWLIIIFMTFRKNVNPYKKKIKESITMIQYKLCPVEVNEIIYSI